MKKFNIQYLFVFCFSLFFAVNVESAASTSVDNTATSQVQQKEKGQKANLSDA